MSNDRPPPAPPDLGAITRELIEDFVDDANAGQLASIAAAAKRTLGSEKAAPVRQLVRELDEANGRLFSRALNALLSRKSNTR